MKQKIDNSKGFVTLTSVSLQGMRVATDRILLIRRFKELKQRAQ